MTLSFRLQGLEPHQFATLFNATDAELRAKGIARVLATSDHGFPCRVSLVDVPIGQELLLLPYLHQPANSPYRASGPIFVSRSGTPRELPPGEVPPYVTTRQMSLRAYDSRDYIVDALVCDGEAVATELMRLFESQEVRYVHLHNARRGCYSCAAFPVQL